MRILLFLLLSVPCWAAITISTPAQYEVIQRSGTTASIDITGTYTGSPTAIEASFNGGAYATIDAAPTGGNYSGTLAAQAQGQGTLTVRFTNDVGQTASTTFVGIGEVFLCCGQSNMSARGTNNQTYSHATLKAGLLHNDYTWDELADPYDSATGQVDTVSSDTGPAAAGSIFPLLATNLMARWGVPVAFIPAAMGGTSITSHLPGVNRLNRSTLYGSANYRAQQTQGIRAVLWWQGETDIVGAMTQATYNGHLDTIANAFMADLGVKMIPCLLQNNTGEADPDEQAVRLAIIEADGDNANVLTGPDLFSLTTNDAYHLKSDSNLLAASDLWADALDDALFPPTAGNLTTGTLTITGP